MFENLQCKRKERTSINSLKYIASKKKYEIVFGFEVSVKCCKIGVNCL